jgi:hypothetical protein
VKKAKAIISVFFILILLILNVRFLLFTSYVKSQKQEFRKQAIAQNLSDLIQIETESKELYKNKRGFEWEKNNKELVINGVYHEVLNVVIRNGKALITIIPDKAENALFERYFHEHKHTQQDHTIALLFQLTFLETISDSKISLPESAFTYPLFLSAKPLKGIVAPKIKPPCSLNTV